MSDIEKSVYPAPPRYYLQFAAEGAHVRPPSPPTGRYTMFGDEYPPVNVDELRPLSDDEKAFLTIVTFALP